uniref:copper homeostasis protein CutC n=1 Tax=Zeaxanthinibacter enoshimensis TaxID=392009 RepID=UPI003561D48D
MIVEVCANSISSALAAERAGADRVELCSELGLGGITPSYGFLKTAVATLNIPLHVLIRPRSGDFTYTSEEFDSMLADIALCKSLGVAGVVSGVLLKDGSIDRLRTAML